MGAREELGRIIWETSRKDEGSVSATGANIIADAILADGWVKREPAPPKPVPLTKEESIAFRKAWDAKVEAGWAKQVRVDVEESCPVRLMDGRNEIRCWYPKGHEGECR